jgi:uncharacterized protein YecE (DUF72 family)
VTDILIGTSGWSYPSGRGTWKGLFYPQRRPRGFDELAYYAARFDTVEVNSTFYRMPEAAQTAEWVRRTPPGFEFAVKLYQKFTHPDMYLAHDGVSEWDVSRDDFDLFRGGIEPLAAAGRLAAVLVQFPSSFHATPATQAYLEWLLTALADYTVAVELRHRSWDAKNSAVVAEHGAARVVGDEPFNGEISSANSPEFSTIRPPSPLYLRLHGRNKAAWWSHAAAEDRYNYLYSPEELEPFAKTAREAAKKGRRVLLYMNNHFSAKSVANAVILKRKLGLPVPGDYPPVLVERYPELEGVVTVSKGTGLDLWKTP